MASLATTIKESQQLTLPEEGGVDKIDAVQIDGMVCDDVVVVVVVAAVVVVAILSCPESK